MLASTDSRVVQGIAGNFLRSIVVTMTRTVASLPNNLRSVRIHEGLTLAGLARKSDVSERTLRDLERGLGRPREVTLHRIINALNELADRRRKIDYAMEDIFPAPRPRSV